MNKELNKQGELLEKTEVLKLDTTIFDPKLDNNAKAWLKIKTQKNYLDFLNKDAIIKEMLELIANNKSYCRSLNIEYEWIEYGSMGGYILGDTDYFIINYKALIKGESILWLESELNNLKHINIILNIVSKQRLTFIGLLQSDKLYSIALLIIIARIDINQPYEVFNHWDWLIKINQSTKLNELKNQIGSNKEKLNSIVNKVVNVLFND